MIKLSVLCIFYQVLVLGLVGARGAHGANNQNLQQVLSNNPLLPSDCGRDLSQRIVGGERTQLGEHPWMALLVFGTPNGDAPNCGGALINHRYVLTAAHCLSKVHLPEGWHLKAVRLGEFDVTKNPDCIRKNGKSYCAAGVVSVGIEKQITHEKYDETSKDQSYDIALLRLKRNIPYTHFVKPICLPPNDAMGKNLVVAGWGTTESSHVSNIKLKVVLPVVNKQECIRRYKIEGITIGYGQMCAGGLRGKDSCTGDSGGPLMTLRKGSDGAVRWTTVGIVSFGPNPCGVQGWPGVYTRVIDFVPWILSKLEP